MTRILSIDPSGTSTTGLFFFENWNNWEISSITAENWLEHAKNLEIYLKNKQVQIVAVEISSMWKKTGYTYHFDKLIKLVGHCEYLASELGIKYVPVSNAYRTKWEQQAKEGKIVGLVCQSEKSLKGRPKQVWYFKGQKLNEHEKDALIVFYTYWVKFLKKGWPFSS